MNNQIKYYLKRLIRQGFVFNKIFHELQKSQYFTKEQLDELQNQKLRKIIHHCYKNVPYYADLFKELKLKPEDITTKEDLQKLPFIDKYIVKDNFDKLIAKNKFRFLCYKTHTSGTTGTPGKIMWDQNSLNYEYAFYARNYQNAGDNGLKRITLRGNLIKPISETKPPFWRLNSGDNELVLSSYHFTKANAPVYIEKIKEFDPQVLNAYPSTAFLLANYLKTSKQEIPLKAVFTSSETLSDSQRAFVEEAFKCPVYDWYGQVERVSAIGQCSKGTYHIQEDYSITEIIETDLGFELVGTHLHNYIMPLIRYKTTDTVELSYNKCGCGCNFREVSKIFGKNSSYYHLLTEDGVKITSFGYIPMGVNNIIETQFIQEKIGELIINVTTNGQFSEKDREQLIKNTLERTSVDMKVIINEVDEILRGPNGKFVSVINKLINKENFSNNE